MKSDRSWIGSVTRIERAFPLERTSAPQPSATAQADGYPEQPRIAAVEFRFAETLGGTAKPGWSPRKGRRFEFLPRRKPCRNTADQAILPSINLKSAVSCLAGVCSCEPRMELYGSQSRTDHRTGRPQMAHPGLNDSLFSASSTGQLPNRGGLGGSRSHARQNEMCENCFR